MSISGIGSYSPSSYQPSSAAGGASSSMPSFADAAAAFDKAANESPMERMVDAWLKAHGLTKESLAKLPPDKQQAIMKEMAKDIADEMKRQATQKASSATGGLVDTSA